MSGKSSFDPKIVAFCEAEGWRAYYDRNWPRMLKLLITVNKQEFSMPLPAALVGAYYTVRAAQAWAPMDHDANAVRHAERFLARFYGLARRHSRLRFVPREAARLELAYWDIARRVKSNMPRKALLNTMIALHSTVFGISVDAARESAELRVVANELVYEITQGTAEDPERNWRDLEEKLRECYRSVLREMGAGT